MLNLTSHPESFYQDKKGDTNHEYSNSGLMGDGIDNRKDTIMKYIQ